MTENERMSESSQKLRSLLQLKKVKQSGFSLLLAFVLLTVFHVSFVDSAKALLATSELMLDRDYDSLLNSNDSDLQRRRRIQQHYLKYDIYIPLEDIVIRSIEPKQSVYEVLLRNACGQGKLYVWVPLKLRLPLIGEKVFEWCLVRKS